MFRNPALTGDDYGGFPRIRGDVPAGSSSCLILERFSPHTRGCSSPDYCRHPGFYVFPAYAGMFRRERHHRYGFKRFPRIRGDVPFWMCFATGWLGFSPHTRGCSRHDPQAAMLLGVFPAYAGMFLIPQPWIGHSSRFPRIRGDVPNPPTLDWALIPFSPHTRGCS